MFKKNVYAKRFAVVLGVFACIAPLSAQGLDISFSNELTSDIVEIGSGGGASFAGIEDEFIMDMTSEHFDLGVDITVGFYGDYNGFYYDDVDWYAAFRPVSLLEFALSKDYEFAGSKMYVEDDNVGGGRMGSDGITIAVIPIDGLKIAFTMPFDVGDSDLFSSFEFGFGAEYEINSMFTVGAALRSWTYGSNNRTVGVSVSAAIFPVKGFSIYVGYNFQDYEGLCDVYGKNLLNFSLSYEASKFAVGLDFLTNFGSHGHDGNGYIYSTDSDYDLYLAVYGEYRISDPLLLYLTLTEQNTFEEGYKTSDNLFAIAPGIEFDTSFGNFSVEVEVAFGQDGFDHVSFPLSWKYEF